MDRVGLQCTNSSLPGQTVWNHLPCWSRGARMVSATYWLGPTCTQKISKSQQKLLPYLIVQWWLFLGTPFEDLKKNFLNKCAIALTLSCSCSIFVTEVRQQTLKTLAQSMLQVTTDCLAPGTTGLSPSGLKEAPSIILKGLMMPSRASSHLEDWEPGFPAREHLCL